MRLPTLFAALSSKYFFLLLALVSFSFIPFKSAAQTFSLVQDTIAENIPDITNYLSGWDELGQVSWKAYQRSGENIWRMIFLDDAKSLSVKYDFANHNKLAGVGMWALGFDDGKQELWDVLVSKFGKKSVDKHIAQKEIHEII